MYYNYRENDSQYIVYIGVLANPVITANWDQLNKELIQPAISFCSGMQSLNSDILKMLTSEIQTMAPNSPLIPFLSQFTPASTKFYRRIIWAQSDTDKNGLCQPIKTIDFLRNIWTMYATSFQPEIYAKDTAQALSDFIDMKNPSTFTVKATRQPNLVILFNLNHDDYGSYLIQNENTDTCKILYINNGRLFNNIGVPNTCQLIQQDLINWKGTFTTRVISEMNKKFSSIIAKIARDESDKSFQLKHKSVANSDKDTSEKIMPVAMLANKFADFEKNIKMSISTDKAGKSIANPQKKSQAQIDKEFNAALLKAIGDMSHLQAIKTAAAYAADEAFKSDEKRKALERSRDLGIEKNQVINLALHDDFEKVMQLVFPGFTMSYK